jgi:hypothetical protein
MLNTLLKCKETKKWRNKYLYNKWLAINEDLAVQTIADFWLPTLLILNIMEYTCVLVKLGVIGRVGLA